MVNVTGLKGIHRKINGKKFTIDARFQTKRITAMFVKDLRKNNYVRIIKLAPTYAGGRVSYGVYLRKKK